MAFSSAAVHLSTFFCQESADQDNDLRQSIRPVSLAAIATLDVLFDTRMSSTLTLDPTLRREQHYLGLQVAKPNPDQV